MRFWLGVIFPTLGRYSPTTLIAKRGKSKVEATNYHPITLLNVDCKIFATIIAERLRKILSTLIHPDQNGFLPKISLRKNIRTTLSVLDHYEKHSDKQLALIFLDAEKAFDNVSWPFIKTLLEYMKFGNQTIHVFTNKYSPLNLLKFLFTIN